MVTKFCFVPDAAEYIKKHVDARLSYSEAVMYALWAWYRSPIIDSDALHLEYENYLRERTNRSTPQGCTQ